jgi:hypothetical protein
LNPSDSSIGSRIFIDGIKYNPENIIEFEEFKDLVMKVDEKQQIIYKNKILKSEKGPVKSDKIIEKGSRVS